MRISWEWRDEWGDTALQRQDSNFEPCVKEAYRVTFILRCLHMALTLRQQVVLGVLYVCTAMYDCS